MGTGVLFWWMGRKHMGHARAVDHLLAFSAKVQNE